MKKDLETRLKELKEEYQKGQEQLVELEQKTANLSSTMLRISGAIQVLQELLDDRSPENSIPEKNGIESAVSSKSNPGSIHINQN